MINQPATSHEFAPNHRRETRLRQLETACNNIMWALASSYPTLAGPVNRAPETAIETAVEPQIETETVPVTPAQPVMTSNEAYIDQLRQAIREA